MVCRSCGANLDPQTRFCPYCGAEQPPANNMADAAFAANAQPTGAPTQSLPPRQGNSWAAPQTTQTMPASSPLPSPQPNTQGHDDKGGAVAAIIFAACAVAALVAVIVIFYVRPLLATPDKSSSEEAVQVEDADGSSSKSSDTDLDTPASEASSSESSASDDSSSSQDAASEPSHVGFKGITSATASSTLATDKVSSYVPENVLDANPVTCWAEGVDGFGIGESITLSGSGTQTFTGFRLTNGYQKTEKIYYMNPRPTKISVAVDGNVVMEVEPPDSYGSVINYDLPEPVDGTSITFTIESTVEGNRYKDTSISDIIVY